MWCEHYQREGLKDGQACKKGIVYDELTEVARLGRTGCALRLPCIKTNHDEEKRKGQPLCFCPHLEWRSEERMARDRQILVVGVERMNMVERLVLTPIRKTHQGKAYMGIHTCPCCDKPLHVGLAPNGHARVQCETENCINWRE